MKTVLACIRYAAFLALIIVLYLFNNHPVMLLFLFVSILAPILSIILFYQSVSKVSCNINLRSGFLYRGESTEMILAADNLSFYPFAHAVFRYTVSNSLNPNSVVHSYDLYIAPKEKMRFELSLRLTNCGNYIVSLESVKLTELFGFVSKTIKPKSAVEAIVYPNELELNDVIEAEGGTPNEETVHERNAKGSDPSEIFEIREYRMGDRPQQIHWKLSAKEQELMSKEFSDSIGESFEVFLCNDYSDNHQMDAYFDLMYSVGMNLAKRGIFFSYSWYKEDEGTIEHMSVDSEDRVMEALLSMYYMQARQNNQTALRALSTIPETLRHVLVLTSQPQSVKGQGRQLLNINNLARLFVL